MGLTQSKKSKMRCRQQKAANRYKGVQFCKCPSCGAPRLPHCVCDQCGNYNGKRVINVEQ